MQPAFENELFKNYCDDLKSSKLNKLVALVQELNDEIAKDASLGTDFQIGHSYFCGCKNPTDEWLSQIIKYDLLPTLKEYWYDDSNKTARWEEKLLSIVE